MEENKYETKTLIIYEAPHKLLSTLNDILNSWGDRQICIAKEITKIHETFIRGKISNILEQNIEPKGEYIIVVEGAEKSKETEVIEQLNNMTIQEHFEYYKKNGMDEKQIIKQIAKDRSVPKNEIYKIFNKK